MLDSSLISAAWSFISSILHNPVSWILLISAGILKGLDLAIKRKLVEIVGGKIWQRLPSNVRDGVALMTGKKSRDEVSTSDTQFPLSAEYVVFDEHGVESTPASRILLSENGSKEVQFTFESDGSHDGWNVIFDVPDQYNFDPIHYNDASMDPISDIEYEIKPDLSSCRLISQIERNGSAPTQYLTVEEVSGEEELLEIRLGPAS